MRAWLAVALVSLSTLAGAWLGKRQAGRVTTWLAIASALMLVTAVIDLVPDAWHEAVEQGVPLWAMGLALALGYLTITYLTRGGHGHQVALPSGRHAPGTHRRIREMARAALFGGVGTAAALTVHRAIEGATLALSSSAVVVITLILHSVGEGLAIVALLDMAGQRLTPLLLVACFSPVAGLLAGKFSPLPSQLVPLLLGLATGILLRTALLGLRLAASRHETGRVPRRHALAAAGVAATVALSISAVHWLPSSITGVFEDPHRQAVLARGHTRPRPTELPPANRVTTPFPYRDRRQLRTALATGLLTLGEVFARNDRMTLRTRVKWLLRGLPGYDWTHIARLLDINGIRTTHTVGELTAEQRADLLTALP